MIAIRRSRDNPRLNILVIMLYWYPYEGPLMPIYGAILRGLMDRGHRVAIVTSFPHFRKGRPETWDEYRGRLIEVSRWDRARLVRSYVYAPVFDQAKPGLVYRALNFISFNVSCVISAILRGGKTDIVFVPSSPPLTNGVCGWIVSLFKHCPVIYNVQDMYPDMAEEMGVVKSGLFIKILKGIEKTVYKLCDRIVVLSEGMRENVLGKGVPVSKTVVIPNFIDSEFISPLPKKNRFCLKWGLADHFVVMYAGNIGIPHGTEVIVEAAEILKPYPEILFCFVGRGEYRQAIAQLTHQKGLSNVQFIPPQPEEEVPYIWASAEVSLVAYKKGLAGFSVPSKLLASMSAARPVIAAVDADSETSKIITESRCGLVVPPENSQALAENILHFYHQPEQCSEMGLEGRRYAETHFSKDSVVSAYEDLFLRMDRCSAISEMKGCKENCKVPDA